ncbi:diguanylate cyclase [Candidatus Bipolaricaulota bacterium]|nr:diguanylate cyclase [Candidatus Bipolaricaulota bacterium]
MILTSASVMLMATATISGAVSVLLWHRRKLVGGTALSLLMMAVAGWAIVAALEAASIGLEAKILWSQFEYLGSGTATTFYLFFALQRAGIDVRLGSKRTIALWLLPIANLTVALTNRWHHLLWTGFVPSSVGVNQVTYLHGPAFYAIIAALYIYILLGSVVLVRGTLHAGLIRQRQNWVVLIAGVVPWAGGLLYAFNPDWLAGINIAPMSFSVSGLVFAVGLIGMRYFDIAPVARDLLFEEMDDGVLVLNGAHQIIDVNPAACRFLNTDSSCIGASVNTILSPWPGLLERCRQSDSEHYEVVISEEPLRVIDARLTPIVGSDLIESGLIVVLRAITARVHAQRKLQEAYDQLQEKVSEISQLQESVRAQAIHDSLTGLFNRRYLEETLPREMASSRRRNAPLSVVLLDVDYFKTVNDAYGHQAGDRTLQALAALLDESTREGDIACRYGGDEFVLVLPDTPLVDAINKAESLRLGCRSLGVDDCPGITISLGVACSPDHGQTGGAILLVADRALYRAKENGRDQVHSGPN